MKPVKLKSKARSGFAFLFSKLFAVFLLAGSLQPGLGGGVIAHNTSLPDLQGRMNADPFVAEKVVSAEVLEIAPSKADARLNFLLERALGVPRSKCLQA
jgi:hypothetical protein